MSLILPTVMDPEQSEGEKLCKRTGKGAKGEEGDGK